MYVPDQNVSKDPAVAAEIMRRYNFASVISTDDDGLPFVSHIPISLDDAGEKWILWGHVARGNVQWKHFHSRPKAVVTFLGAHAFQPAKIYSDPRRAQSWNYVAVHCVVNVCCIDDHDGKVAIIKRLIAENEPEYDVMARWPDDALRARLRAVVGFKMDILDLQCKLKLNQQRPEARLNLHAAYSVGNEQERDLARWMEKAGVVEPHSHDSGDVQGG